MSLPQGIVCTPEQYARSLRDPLIHCLTKPETIGLILKTEAGFLSLVSVLYVAFLVLRNVLWRIRHLSKDRFRVFHQPIDLLMFSLFLGEFLQATGIIFSISWIQDGKVETGAICNAQGILISTGEASVAITTMVITVYTFVVMWTGRDLSMGMALGVVWGIWVLVALLAVVGKATSNQGPFLTPTPLWCWLSGNRFWWRILAVYAWIWLSLLLSLLLYALLYFWMRGHIIVDEQKWWRFSFSRRGKSNPAFRGLRQRSSIMLAYPLATCIAYLPASVVRWTNYSKDENYSPPLAWTFVAISLFALSGFINVVLLLSTRPEAGLFGQLMFRRPGVPLLPLVTPEPPQSEVGPTPIELQSTAGSQKRSEGAGHRK